MRVARRLAGEAARACRQPLSQRTSLQQLQGTVGRTRRLADLVDVDDVRMPQPGNRLGLDPEPCQVLGPERGVAPHHLQGDEPLGASCSALKTTPISPSPRRTTIR